MSLPDKSEPLRSLGIQFPIDDDPVKLRGCIVDDWIQFRAECMACGFRSRFYSTAGEARAVCKQHASGVAHRRLTTAARGAPR